MKKLFALFFAFTLLFLTACNTTTTPAGTEGGQTPPGTTNSGNWLDAYRGKVVAASSLNDFIDVSSRIVFEHTVSDAGEYGGNQTYTFLLQQGGRKGVHILLRSPLRSQGLHGVSQK